MAIEWMKELTSKLLKAIALKIQKKDRSTWFEIFLTMFVLLNNLEYVYGIQQAFRAYLGRTVRINTTSIFSSTNISLGYIWNTR
jgi:uncharacterized membrane protein